MATIDRFLTARPPPDLATDFAPNVAPSVTTNLPIKSRSGFKHHQPAQVYLRLVIKGTFTQVQSVGSTDHNVPAGRILTPEELSKFYVLKLGQQGWNTGRQKKHDSIFGEGLLDSFPTQFYHLTEDRIKTFYLQKQMLYKGLHEGKTQYDTELLLIPRDNAQSHYDTIADNFRRIVENTRMLEEANFVEAKRIEKEMQDAAHKHAERMKLLDERIKLHEIIAASQDSSNTEFFKQRLALIDAALQAM